MIDIDQILPNLYIGTYLKTPEDIQELKDTCGITAVLNLQTDEDLQEKGIHWPSMEGMYKKLGIEVHRVPMRDYDYDHQRDHLPEAVKALSGLLASGHVTYLHCNAGVSRAPLVAMAYLYWCRKMALEDAINRVWGSRSCSPYLELLEEAPENISSC